MRAGLSLEQLSAERAAFVAEAFNVPRGEALSQFQARDAALHAAGRHDEIVLWFEHDLYDQLQLIQVLDALAELRGPPISLVCEEDYLGRMAPERAAELFALRNPVTRRHFREAQAAWAAFRSPDPKEIQNVRSAALPYLAAALRRQLEEFPWAADALSRTERQVLEALSAGPLGLHEILRRIEEEPAFLADAVLAWHLQRMEKEGFLERRGDRWALRGKTRARRVLRWLGGYEVRDESVRWDPALGRLVS